jgi:DNA-binding transcriptional ArsR family regulator
MDKQQAVHSLGALAHPVRLDVFRALVVAGPEGVTPGVFMERLGVPSATLSFHLKELSNAGLVEQERAGRNVIYRAAYPRMDALIGFLTENCCQGLPASADATSAACSGC